MKYISIYNAVCNVYYTMSIYSVVSVQADFSSAMSPPESSSEFSQSLKAFVSGLVVFVRGSLQGQSGR